MKRKREVVLDFTSLLDVIMLILFFFVIFAQLDTSEAIANAEAAQAQAEEAQAQAEEAQAEADEAISEAEEEKEKYEQANALAQSIILNNTDEFDRALSIKTKLENDNITILCSNEKIGEISNIRMRDPIELAKDLSDIISSQGYSGSDAILCEMLYNSIEAGSYKSKTNSIGMVDEIRNEYPYFFYSLTDLSEFEGENE